MKKLTMLLLGILLGFFGYAQNPEDLRQCSLPELYVELSLDSKENIRALSQDFTIDKVWKAEDEKYGVRVWLPSRQYADFMQLAVPFSVVGSGRPPHNNYTMATSVETLLQWNVYPTYPVYVAFLDSMQRRFPHLCHIDTILAQTPNQHSILVAHLTKNVTSPNVRPRFFYSSTMHGDEVTGYYCMLRLIDDLLTHYETDDEVQMLLQRVDLWICPLENPDGTYYTSDSKLGNSPVSTRANAHSIDLNRVYPGWGEESDELEPEVAAMTAFASQHHFTMSANFHGGSELLNFPWDSWTCNEVKHADYDWWEQVCRQYADTVHQYADEDYFVDENEGVTPGGDWYVITGSRQDYMNYFQHCREVTIEISADKAPSSNAVDAFWQAQRQSLLNHIKTVNSGFSGTVYDSLTRKAIAGAKIFIEGHDSLSSEVYLDVLDSMYYRPIKEGIYDVTFSAENYCEKTVAVRVNDSAMTRIDVALLPFPCDADTLAPADTSEVTPDTSTVAISQTWIGRNEIKIYPNPVKNKVNVEWATSPQLDNQYIDYQIFDILGQQKCGARACGDHFELDMSKFAAGVYFLKLNIPHEPCTIKIVKE